jgi:CheY-like chemotaxis protein
MSVARILVAGEDRKNLERIQTHLDFLGYDVRAATDGNLALDLAESGIFDLLILDVHMPLYGGQEVLQILRTRLMFHTIKIIALTADVRWALRAEMRRSGVDSYLIKPVSLAELDKEICRLLMINIHPLSPAA